MNWTSIVALLGAIEPVLLPIVKDLENNTLQPELQKLIGQVSDPALQSFLKALDQGLTNFVNAELAKI